VFGEADGKFCGESEVGLGAGEEELCSNVPFVVEEVECGD
jgi:hypothetical protein